MSDFEPKIVAFCCEGHVGFFLDDFNRSYASNVSIVRLLLSCMALRLGCVCVGEQRVCERIGDGPSHVECVFLGRGLSCRGADFFLMTFAVLFARSEVLSSVGVGVSLMSCSDVEDTVACGAGREA